MGRWHRGAASHCRLTMTIFFYRHVKYVERGKNAGMPILAELTHIQCASSFVPVEDTILGTHQIDYTAFGLPVQAIPLVCCNGGEKNVALGVEEACTGYPGGVSRVLRGYVREINNCRSARNQRIDFEYSEGAGTNCGCESAVGVWTGSLSLRGGTLEIEICCSGGSLGLHIHGCNGINNCLVGSVECVEPLIIQFGNVTLLPDDDLNVGCCDCQNTPDAPEINIVVVGNCFKSVKGRHIDYSQMGSPVAAVANCGVQTGPAEAACNPTCGLKMIIEASGDCGCMSGEPSTLGYWPMVFSSGGDGIGTWVGEDPDFPFSVCEASLGATVTCSSNGDGTVTISVTITCAVTNSGSGSVIVDEVDLEFLDVIIPVSMEDPFAPDECTGVCQYQCIGMAGSWNPIGNTCTPSCEITFCSDEPTAAPTCNDGNDGAIYEEDCRTLYEPGCCVGSINVRIMR